jgi:hypothetical protein
MKMDDQKAREYNKTDDFKKNMKKELISDQRNEKIPWITIGKILGT